jgi:hypothetical protein
MRALLFSLAAVASIAAEPPKQPKPPGDTWTGDGAKVTVRDAKRGKTGYFRASLTVEALSADRLVDVSKWTDGTAAVDAKGNALKVVEAVNGATAGTVRHGKPAVVSFVFVAPAETAEWVDLSFGPVRLRVKTPPASP